MFGLLPAYFHAFDMTVARDVLFPVLHWEEGANVYCTLIVCLLYGCQWNQLAVCPWRFGLQVASRRVFQFVGLMYIALAIVSKVSLTV